MNARLAAVLLACLCYVSHVVVVDAEIAEHDVEEILLAGNDDTGDQNETAVDTWAEIGNVRGGHKMVTLQMTLRRLSRRWAIAPDLWTRIFSHRSPHRPRTYIANVFEEVDQVNSFLRKLDGSMRSDRRRRWSSSSTSARDTNSATRTMSSALGVILLSSFVIHMSRVQ